MTGNPPPMRRRLARRATARGWRFAAGALLLAGLMAVLLWPDTVAVDVAVATRGPLMVTVDDEGETRVRDRYVVSAPVTGRVERIAVEPGDAVVPGQILTRVRPEAPPLLDERSRAEVLAAIESARAVVGRARAERARADEAAAQARREQERARVLHEGGAMSRQQRDLREDEADQADAAAQAAAFAAAAAAAGLRQAEARLAAAPVAAGDRALSVRAPVRGVVLRRWRESEAIVAAGEPLVEIGDPSRLEIVADLLSADAVMIPAGARALVDQWGGEQTLEARVRRVEPSGFTKVSALGVEEQRVNVRLDFVDTIAPGVAMGDGYRLEVRIVLWEGADVLRVPASALFRVAGDWAVYVVDGGRVRRTAVKVGHRSAQLAEILSGLSSGATVVVFPPDSLDDGMRVAPQPTSE